MKKVLRSSQKTVLRDSQIKKIALAVREVLFQAFEIKLRKRGYLGIDRKTGKARKRVLSYSKKKRHTTK